MNGEILVRSEGSGQAKTLEEKVLSLKDTFAGDGVAVHREIKKNYIVTGAIFSNQLFITVIGTVIGGLILKLVDILLGEDAKGIDIHINIKDSKVKFNLPEDRQKILDYLKKGNNK